MNLPEAVLMARLSAIPGYVQAFDLAFGTLYLTTPFNRVVALDPGTGAERWSYDPRVDRSQDYSEVASRGVAAWSDAGAADGTPCKLRLFEGTIDARLIALDATNGKPCADFGHEGTVDLTRGSSRVGPARK